MTAVAVPGLYQIFFKFVDDRSGLWEFRLGTDMTSLSIRKQIYLAVGSVLMLLTGIAGLGYLATVQLSGIFSEYKATAHQTLLANELVEGIFNAQFAVYDYRLDPSKAVVDAVGKRVERNTEGHQAAVRLFAGDKQALDRLHQIEMSAKGYRDAFARMVELKGRSDELVAELKAIGPDIREKLTAVMDFAYENGDTWVGYDVGIAQQEFMRGRFYQERYLLTNDPASFETAMVFMANAIYRVEALYARIYEPDIQTVAREAITSISAYVDLAIRNQDIIKAHNVVRDQELDRLGPQIKQDLHDLLDVVVNRQEKLGLDGSKNASMTRFLVIMLSVGALCIGCALAGFIARRISGSVCAMADTMTELADGNLDVVVNDMDKGHELGMMARALSVFKTNAGKLREALDKERELSGLQRQFVSMVSHEFRTPLAIIDAQVQRLTRHPEKITPDKALKVAKTVRTSVLRLTDLMESVLSAARMEDGQIKFEPELFDIGAMTREVCGNYRDINSDHKVEIDLDALPTSFHGDVKLLRQVVSNLISNAIKYSPADTTIFIRGYETRDDQIVISVEDQGVGIPGDELGKLSERFFRASTSTGISGSGIGLHLVKHLIELHEGEMKVESVVGEGTTFQIMLPARQAKLAPPDDTEDGDEKSLAKAEAA